DGQQQVGKERIEEIDKENKIVRFKIIEGDILNEFTSFVTVLQVISKEGLLSGIKWTIEYEKIQDDGNCPTNMIDLLVKLTKDIEVHLQPAAN
ncbi:MLP-like protein 31, partial [Bienertia sinuspersici]